MTVDRRISACQRWRQWADRDLLGVLPAADARLLRLHVRGCEACRVYRRAGRRLAAGIGAAAAPKRGDAPADRLLQRCLEEARQRQRRHRIRRRAAALSGAAAAVAAVLWAAALQEPGVSPGAEAVRTAGASPHAPWRLSGVRPCRGTNTSYPLAHGDVLLAFDDAGRGRHLLAVERATGRLRWRTAFAVSDCSLLADGTTAFVRRQRRTGVDAIAAVDLADGSIAWERAMAGVGAEPAFGMALASHALCWIADDRVTAVDARTGSRRWEGRLAGGRIHGAPVANGAALFVVSPTAIEALSAVDGRPLWSAPHPPAGRRPALPVLGCDAGSVVAASGVLGAPGTLRCHAADTGALRWSKALAEPVQAVTVATDVYVRGRQVAAFSGRTGEPFWAVPLDGCSPAVTVGPRVYLSRGEGCAVLVALDARTGAIVWQHSLAAACSGLAIVDRMGYVTSRDGVLHALSVDWPG